MTSWSQFAAERPQFAVAGARESFVGRGEHIVHFRQAFFLVLVALVGVLLACGDAEHVGSPEYELFIEPGLHPELPLSRVVPDLPAPFGGGRLSGTIQSIERVAFVSGENVPSVHPSLPRQPPRVPVWVVLCHGRFQTSGPFGTSSSGTRAFYLVHHESGIWLRWGLLSTEAS